jgi:probable addiction module antidote protein
MEWNRNDRRLWQSQSTVLIRTMSKAARNSRTKTTAYDVAEHLRTPEEMAAYLDAWLEEAPDDAAGIAKALGNIARAKGMTQVAKDAGLSRESLYRALSADGNPSFATVLKVARALGVKLHAAAV